MIVRSVKDFQTVSSKSFVITSNGLVPDEIKLGVGINGKIYFAR